MSATVSANQVTLNLTGGFYMTDHVTDDMIDVMWRSMSTPQVEEFEIMYGKEGAFEGFKSEVKDADHAVAIFNCASLACLMWANWAEHGGIGRVRTLGCVCSRYSERHMHSFVRHSKECLDAFMLTEPKGVKEIYVFITETYKISRNWAVRVCGFKEYCMATANGKAFVCYRYIAKEDK